MSQSISLKVTVTSFSLKSEIFLTKISLLDLLYEYLKHSTCDEFEILNLLIPFAGMYEFSEIIYNCFHLALQKSCPLENKPNDQDINEGSSPHSRKDFKKFKSELPSFVNELVDMANQIETVPNQNSIMHNITRLSLFLRIRFSAIVSPHSLPKHNQLDSLRKFRFYLDLVAASEKVNH